MTEQEQANYRNLLDAGCTKETAEAVLRLLQSGKTGLARRLLAQHRNELLDRLHLAQRQLDCLDYFLYQIRP